MCSIIIMQTLMTTELSTLTQPQSGPLPDAYYAGFWVTAYIPWEHLTLVKACGTAERLRETRLQEPVYLITEGPHQNRYLRPSTFYPEGVRGDIAYPPRTDPGDFRDACIGNSSSFTSQPMAARFGYTLWTNEEGIVAYQPQDIVDTSLALMALKHLHLAHLHAQAGEFSAALSNLSKALKVSLSISFNISIATFDNLASV